MKPRNQLQLDRKGFDGKILFHCMTQKRNFTSSQFEFWKASNVNNLFIMKNERMQFMPKE